MRYDRLSHWFINNLNIKNILGLNLAKTKRLLIIGPAFRRRTDERSLPALERYDGLFYRVARKHLRNVKDVDVLIMKDDLTLVAGSESLPFVKPEGTSWGVNSIPSEVVENAKKTNLCFLKEKLRKNRYSEVFISMGKKYAAALPDMSSDSTKVLFPANVGPGLKAQALKEWFSVE